MIKSGWKTLAIFLVNSSSTVLCLAGVMAFGISHLKEFWVAVGQRVSGT